MNIMPKTAPWNPTVLWSKPEAERAGTPLLVLFHGYLANEEDLMGLADYLPSEFTIASVRAPQALGPGYTWFPLMNDADFSVERVVDAVDDVAGWLDSVKDVHSSVSLLGFSMGMAVASTLLRHRVHPARFELAGLPDGTYPGHSQIPFSQTKKGTRVTIAGTETLIGGCASLDECVRSLREWSRCSIAQAVMCVTENVAEFMGDDTRGELEEGCRADFVVLGKEGEVRETWIGGKKVWARE